MIASSEVESCCTVWILVQIDRQYFLSATVMHKQNTCSAPWKTLWIRQLYYSLWSCWLWQNGHLAHKTSDTHHIRMVANVHSYYVGGQSIDHNTCGQLHLPNSRRMVWRVLACAIIRMLKMSITGGWKSSWQPANQGLPAKWPLKWCMHVCVDE